jgi:glycosyltransferase involved in cell wall biosynthesis
MTEKVSVVISTSGSLERRSRFIEVLDSILAQDYQYIEIIVVWQGEPNCDFFQCYPSAKFLNVKLRNVCKCRNLGAKNATGEYVWFIDDDTTVPDIDTLSYGLSVLKSNDLDYLVANVICEGELKALESHNEDFIIRRNNLRGAFSEPGLLFRKACFLNVMFDEGIGIGCIHGSSEGFDLGARLIKKNYTGQVTKDFKLSHPQIIADTNEQALLHRVFFYSLGNSKVLISNKYYKNYIYEVLKCVFFILQGLLTLNKSKVKVFFMRLLCFFLGPILPKGER